MGHGPQEMLKTPLMIYDFIFNASIILSPPFFEVWIFSMGTSENKEDQITVKIIGIGKNSDNSSGSDLSKLAKSPQNSRKCLDSLLMRKLETGRRTLVTHSISKLMETAYTYVDIKGNYF